jgi:hypothetical protein
VDEQLRRGHARHAARQALMAEFRFLAEDIITGQVKTKDLRLSGWSCTDLLNRPGNLTAQIGITDPDCTEQILDPWKTAIYLMRDGQIEWGGILAPPSLGLGDQALSISCFGWTGYWDRRVIRVDRQFSATDQFEIVQTLIEDAQDEAEFGEGWDLGIVVTWDALSGVLRDRLEAYRSFQAKNLGEAIRQLAALEDGFDFTMLYEIDTGTDRIDKSLKLWYPRKGRDTDFVFEYDRTSSGGNVLARGFADQVEFAWAGDGWGSGSDETKLSSPYVDEDLRGVFPPYEDAPSFSSVIEQETLDENTVAWFAAKNRPRRTPVLEVDPDRYPKWGDWSMGDTAYVRIVDGYGSTGAAGPQTNRITGWTIADAGQSHQIIVGDPDLALSA